jgi:bidirectional [NiFe] hydrogenase diaphorase subunit
VPSKKVSLRIDGTLVSAFEGQTVLEAARANGNFIPTLCALEGVSPVGGCRLCIVEVSGSDRLLTACTAPVQEGMSIITNSPRLTAHRRISVELLLVERNHVCAVCVSNRHCELQALAASLNVDTVRFAYNYPKLGLDLSHPRFVLDHNRCVLCTRCVRVCGELEGAHVWDLSERGIRARIISELKGKWGESQSCTNCGKCVQACPTGALVEKGRAAEEMIKGGNAITSLVRHRSVHS